MLLKDLKGQSNGWASINLWTCRLITFFIYISSDEKRKFSKHTHHVINKNAIKPRDISRYLEKIRTLIWLFRRTHISYRIIPTFCPVHQFLSNKCKPILPTHIIEPHANRSRRKFESNSLKYPTASRVSKIIVWKCPCIMDVVLKIQHRQRFWKCKNRKTSFAATWPSCCRPATQVNVLLWTIVPWLQFTWSQNQLKDIPEISKEASQNQQKDYFEKICQNNSWSAKRALIREIGYLMFDHATTASKKVFEYDWVASTYWNDIKYCEISFASFDYWNAYIGTRVWGGEWKHQSCFNVTII